MLINERHNLIILELQKNPGITVREMAQKLNYSEPTIRRDYTELERRGILTKYYGGAALNRSVGAADQEIPFVLRENERSKPKEKMGMLASRHIRDGMVIMLDGSTSAYHLVPYLSRFKDIIVITSGAKTAVALAELQIPVFCTGGRMRTNSFSYIGKEAEDAVRRYNADIAFFSCHGLSEDGRMSVTLSCTRENGPPLMSEPMRLAGIRNEYSSRATHQLVSTMITIDVLGEMIFMSWSLRLPYQASVIKLFEMINSRMVIRIFDIVVYFYCFIVSFLSWAAAMLSVCCSLLPIGCSVPRGSVSQGV